MMVSVLGGRLPTPLSFFLCCFTDTLRGWGCKQQKSQLAKVSFSSLVRMFWVFLELERGRAQKVSDYFMRTGLFVKGQPDQVAAS